ncbi:MAG: hypothetical protein NVSMB9_06940 [Isosphaeraceae bacterium]
MIDRLQPSSAGLSDQAEEISARAMEFLDSARTRLRDGNEFLKHYVQTEPARALGLALGLGVVLGWLIKRR